MTERPIIFSAPMVRALLDGTKTQTRRVCKKAESAALAHVVDCGNGIFGDEAGDVRFRSPYGRSGDRLWVRETFLDLHGTGIEHRDSAGQRQRHAFAADTPSGSYSDEARKAYGLKWTPSIHMPRAASRILLEVTGVRVERLQDISDQDAIAEGIDRVENNYGNGPAYCDYRMAHPDDTAEWFNSPIRSYRSLWEYLNGAGSWDANQWVWVVEFKRVMP